METITGGEDLEAQTMSDGKFEAIAYAEHDKLGPLTTSMVQNLLDPVELRTALLAAFGSAVQDAKRAVTQADDALDPAVHLSRKALRRCRALLAVIGRALPKSERRDIDRALQESRRALSNSRDHAVAPGTLAELELGDEDRATANRVIANAAEARPDDADIKQLLAEAAARAAAQHEALTAALPAELYWDLVLDGIARTYGEARSARASAKKSRPWFHTWRRRTKELVNQLAVLSVHAGPRVEAMREELVGVSDTLGGGVDLIMARDFVTTYGQGATAKDLKDLRSAIDARLEDLMKDTRKAARDSFAQKPAKFAKRLAKAARRDLTPADDANLTELVGD